MKIKTYILVLLLVGGSVLFGQQQTLFTNYLVNQYLYNPAYAGVLDGTQINAGYRNQWVGFDGSPKTYMLNGYGKMKKKPNMALGAILTSERIGLLQRTSFYGTYSYHLKINKKAAINFGIGVGGIRHRVRVYDAKPYDKDDAYLGSDVLSAFAFDANAGFYFYTKNFFLGFSDQQMPNAKILWANSIGRNTNHFYAYTGYNFHFGSKKEWIVQPSVLVRTNSPVPYQYELHAKLIYDEMLWLGLSYRDKSSACALIGCNINKQYSASYSYDYTLTQLSNYSTGSHEIMLSYLIPFKKKKSKSDLIKDADEEELNKIDNTLKTNLRSKKKKEEEKKSEEESEKAKEPEPEKPSDTVPSEPEKSTDAPATEPEKTSETPVIEKSPETDNQTINPEVIPEEKKQDATEPTKTPESEN